MRAYSQKVKTGSNFYKFSKWTNFSIGYKPYGISPKITGTEKGSASNTERDVWNPMLRVPPWFSGQSRSSMCHNHESAPKCLQAIGGEFACGNSLPNNKEGI